MAGNTFVTQDATVAYIASNKATTVTQVAALAYVTATFSTWTTQVAVVAYVWGAFRTRVTQEAAVAWVIACDSSSYVAPALTGLIVLAAASGSSETFEIDLTWNALDGYTYTVKRSLTSGGAQTTIATGLTVTHYEDAGRTANTTYYYEVVGTNPCGDSTTSNEASATFTCTAPPAPLTLTATWSSTGVLLAWEPVANSTYSVYRIRPGEADFSVIVTGLTTETYLDTGATVGTNIYAVAAVNACGMRVGDSASVHVPCCTQWTQGPGCDTDWTPATEPVTNWAQAAEPVTPWTAAAQPATAWTAEDEPVTTWTKEGC